MHYYQFNIGDYAAHTAHLDEIEDLAYRRMLDYCYLNECGLPETVEEIARVIRMRTHCERIATVLLEFFTLHSDGTYRNKRVEDEIVAFREKSKKASESARKRWENDDANALRTECEGNANHKPITNNHKPITNKNTTPRKRDDTVSVDYLISVGCDAQAAKDWLAIRKQKKLPLTATALKTIQSEADKAGVTLANAIEIAASNSWAGFKASWLQNQAAQEAKQPESFIALHTDRSWADGMTSSFMSGQRIDAQRLLSND